VAVDCQRHGTRRCGRLAVRGLRRRRGKPHQVDVDECDVDPIAGLQQGAQIFQAKCASCHDAKLGGQVVKDFPNIDDEIAVVTNGRVSSLETMPSFKGFSRPLRSATWSSTRAPSSGNEAPWAVPLASGWSTCCLGDGGASLEDALRTGFGENASCTLLARGRATVRALSAQRRQVEARGSQPAGLCATCSIVMRKTGIWGAICSKSSTGA
jgi:hypothetical protein